MENTLQPLKIESLIHEIRGHKVMLDRYLAKLYGVTTGNLNKAVKRNIERFPERYMFQLNSEEYLKFQNGISSWGGTRSLPYAFTEQGIYMLMTVLRGDLAIQQSRALIRAFKRMKDYIVENQSLIGEREYLQLSMQVSNNIKTTLELRESLNEVEDQMAEVMDKLSDVVVRSDLSEIMNGFGEPHIKRGYLILNGQPFLADVAYDEIYRCAKKSIYIVDNYIGIKTLELLTNVSSDIEIKIFSDNLISGLKKNVYGDFRKEFPLLDISLFCSGGIFHDRYIILDFETEHERIFHCGASSKDAGAKVTTILEDLDHDKYHLMISSLLKNSKLTLS